MITSGAQSDRLHSEAMGLRAVSHGGGHQTTAMLVLAARGEIDFDLFLFANVGDDSEDPDTLSYMSEVAVPFAAEHGIEIVELRKTRHKKPDSLLSAIKRGRRVIPFRREKDGPPMNRACTAEWKVRPVAAELKRRGATAENPATVAIGYSTDEMERARTPGVDPRNPTQYVVYPLLDLGLRRSDCTQIIIDAGLPVPPPSSCWFCPNHKREVWVDIRRRRPDRFEAAVDLERWMTENDPTGRPVFFTRSGQPLDRAISQQGALFGDDCESGSCFT